jgi:hypothetical protein
MLKTIWVKKIRVVRTINPERYFTQKSLAVLTGWVKRKDLVFLANSLVKEIAPSNKEKRSGRTK